MVSGMPHFDSHGRFAGYRGTGTDISARRKAEDEAQRSAQLLRGAIDAVDEAFVLYDPQDRLVFCNDKYRSIYAASSDLIVPGASFEEIVRKGAERGQFADAVGRVDEWVAERLAAHRGGDTELVQQTDDGRSLRIVERKMPDGHIVGFRIDITNLVRATEAAQDASVAAESATVAKSQFLANMSHEIRTPMNAILGMLALLGKTGLTSRQADYAGKTEGAARALMGLLNGILDFSKVEAGKMTLDSYPFYIDQLLRELSVIVSANIGPKAVEVLFDIDPALPHRLVGDAMRLQQVLINLSGNAIKFTAEGEVVISMTVVQNDDAAVSLRIAVRDTGIGIASENHARVFSGFTQAEACTTRRYGGTGLGVAISQRLVALMGGELKLDSALGEGSCFHFCITLPIAGAAEDEVSAQGALAVPLRTLVIDDNSTAREVLARMGSALGWRIDVADSGERALELLKARNAAGIAYEAVFVDSQVPGRDTKLIRELTLNATAPVIVMVTAHDREMLEQRSAAEHTRLDDFLVKPVTASMLFDAVAQIRSGHAPPHASGPVVAAGALRLLGMRVLVTDDNLNNQQVARELLQHQGAIVQIANNGQEALDAVTAAEPGFDVVLMDLQMPVMDGFTATSRIRENLGLLTLPIVAMTANAMASDRDACLAAGMNDHVGKPFDLNHLVRVLRQHAGWQEAPVAPAVAELALSDAVSAAAADAGVDIAIALDRIGGNLDLYQRMLRLFVSDLGVMPAQLSDHAAQGEAEAAMRLLHTLKGVASTMGASALSSEAALCEKQFTTGPGPAEVNATLRQASAAIIAARPGLVALLQTLQTTAIPGDEPGATQTAALDAGVLLVALCAMAGQLQNADMAATGAMTEIMRQFGNALDAQLQPMDDAVSALDFDRALGLCNALIRELNEGQAA